MLCLVRPKACKRCGGDLSLERDKYGTYAECIQCGAVLNLSALTERLPNPGTAHQATPTTTASDSHK